MTADAETSPTARSASFDLTEYDAWQAELRAREWSLGDVPFYRGKGEEHDPLAWQDVDYLDIYDKIYGRKCGSAGIGKLREVGLTRVTRWDNYADHPYYEEDPAYITRDGFLPQIDVPKMEEEQLALAETLESNGVRVYWIEYPDRPMTGFGQMTNMLSASELMVVPGGSIVGKKGYGLAPIAGCGRTEYLARWAFWNLGIPVLLTVIGKGVYVRGEFLSDDVYVQAISVETNREAVNQVAPVLRRVCGADLHIRYLIPPGLDYLDRSTGANAHTCMVIQPLDVDKVLAYPPSIDAETLMWLRESGYEIVEAERDEQIQHNSVGLIVLEPGHVLMHASAKNAIADVERAGIQVTPVEYEEYNRFGGGIACTVMQILRDPGPRHFE